jgi:hypothetical protein
MLPAMPPDVTERPPPALAMRTLARLARAAAPAALLLYVLGLYGATAALQDGLFERDGYYHARLAQLMPDRGLSRHFPWTQVSTWKDGYCDKEVLYHAAMAPLAQLGPEPILGARIFSVLLAALVIGALLLVLRAHGVPWPTWFAALPLSAGGLFLARLGMIRSHVLSMLLLTLGLHLMLRRRWRALLLLGFVYAWCYTVPFVLVLTAIPFAAGAWLGKGGLDWRSVLAAGTGAALGLVIHPYSPLTLETVFTYLQILRIGLAGVGSSGFELGNEIYPYPLPVFFDIYPLLLLGGAALGLVVVVRWRRLSAEALGTAAACLFWAGMTTASARFVEYLVLLLALASGLVARDLARGEPALAAWFGRARWRRWAGGLAALGLLAGFHAHALKFYRTYQTRSAPARFFDGAGAWMAGHLAPGETVINLFWDDFPDLFYSAPRQHYLWGLDPTYSLRFDEARARLLERTRRREIPLDPRTLARTFGARYLVLRASRAAAYVELQRPPSREVYRDASAVVFSLQEPVDAGDGPTPPPPAPAPPG